MKIGDEDLPILMIGKPITLGNVDMSPPRKNSARSWISILIPTCSR